MDVLKNKCKYQKIVVDTYWNPDTDNGKPELFTSSFRLDLFFLGYKKGLRNHDGVSLEEQMSQIDKICWGCDTWTVEESYGSLLAFRFSLCKVLSEKIADGYLSVNNAKDIINKILFDNAQNIYF